MNGNFAHRGGSKELTIATAKAGASDSSIAPEDAAESGGACDNTDERQHGAGSKPARIKSDDIAMGSRVEAAVRARITGDGLEQIIRPIGACRLGRHLAVIAFVRKNTVA